MHSNRGATGDRTCTAVRIDRSGLNTANSCPKKPCKGRTAYRVGACGVQEADPGTRRRRFANVFSDAQWHIQSGLYRMRALTEGYRSGHNGTDSKSVEGITALRGFESLPFRQKQKDPPREGLFVFADRERLEPEVEGSTKSYGTILDSAQLARTRAGQGWQRRNPSLPFRQKQKDPPREGLIVFAGRGAIGTRGRGFDKIVGNDFGQRSAGANARRPGTAKAQSLPFRHRTTRVAPRVEGFAKIAGERFRTATADPTRRRQSRQKAQSLLVSLPPDITGERTFRACPPVFAPNAPCLRGSPVPVQVFPVTIRANRNAVRKSNPARFTRLAGGTTLRNAPDLRLTRCERSPHFS